MKIFVVTNTYSVDFDVEQTSIHKAFYNENEAKEYCKRKNAENQYESYEYQEVDLT